MLIDTHCHLSKEYYDDIDKVIKDDEKMGIDNIIVSSCDVLEYDEVTKYSKKYNLILLSFGIHPEYASTTTKADLEKLEKVLISTPKVVALGEIGLDYHYTKENKSEQQQLFRKQLKLAEKLSLPVVIHSRDAVEDTIKILKEFPKVKGVIHCFSGSLETANIYIKMGYKLGIGGVVTFKNSKLSEVVKKIPIESIVVETDSPFLTPDPYRGKTNSSKYLPYILQKISEIKCINYEEIEKIIINNTKNIFNL